MSKIPPIHPKLVLNLYCLTILKLAENVDFRFAKTFDDVDFSTIEGYTELSEYWRWILLILIDKMLMVFEFDTSQLADSIFEQVQDYINRMVELRLPLFSFEDYAKTLYTAIKEQQDRSEVMDILIYKNIHVIHDIIAENIKPLCEE